MAIKKNPYIAWSQLSVDVLEKVEELRNKRNVKNVYDVWRFTKPEGLDRSMYVPQELTKQLYGMLKVWSWMMR